jgi:hypothetical protein
MNKDIPTEAIPFLREVAELLAEEYLREIEDDCGEVPAKAPVHKNVEAA